MKVLIITALLKEQKALLDKIDQLEEVKSLRQNSIAKIEVLNSHSNDLIDVEIINLDNFGNVEAAVKTTQAIIYFDPDFVILTGICGGFKVNPALNLGDIIIPDRIIYYEHGKVKNNQIHRRYINFEIDALTIRNVRDFILNDWDKQSKSFGNNFKYPNIHINPIASGEKVVADKEFQMELINYCKKLIGVEMEGYGTGLAVLKSRKPIKFLIAKAISDWADNNKNDDRHEFASMVSAEFVIYFIKNFNFDLILN